MAVVVVISHRHSHPIAVNRQARLLRHLFEPTIPTVPVEGRIEWPLACEARKTRGVDEEEVQLSIPIVVQECASRTHRLRKVEAPRAPVDVAPADAYLL